MRNNYSFPRAIFFLGLISFLFFLLLLGCSPDGKNNAVEEGHGKNNCLKPDSINPNGTSELAQLMRDMHLNASRLRDSIVNGKSIGAYPVSFQRMYTAQATDPSVRSAAFDNFTDSYLNSLKAIYTAKDSSRRHVFNQMIDGCITCHNQYCMGPVKMIGKLKVGETGL